MLTPDELSAVLFAIATGSTDGGRHTDQMVTDAEEREALASTEAETRIALTVEEEIRHLRGDLLASWTVIEEMRRSRSWRITTPLRRVKAAATRR